MVTEIKEVVNKDRQRLDHNEGLVVHFKEPKQLKPIKQDSDRVR